MTLRLPRSDAGQPPRATGTEVRSGLSEAIQDAIRRFRAGYNEAHAWPWDGRGRRYPGGLQRHTRSGMGNRPYEIGFPDGIHAREDTAKNTSRTNANPVVSSDARTTAIPGSTAARGSTNPYPEGATAELRL